MSDTVRQVDITNEGYGRWLRAQRPPWEFFFTLSEMEQEQLASMGDDHMEDMGAMLALIISNAEAYMRGKGLMQGDESTEESVALQAAQHMAQKLASEQGEPASMAGMGGRISQGVEYTTKGRPTLFGKEPD